MKRIITESLLVTVVVLGLCVYWGKTVNQVKDQVKDCTKAAEAQVNQLKGTLDQALKMAEQALPDVVQADKTVTTDEDTRLVSILYDEKGNYIREEEENLPVYLSKLTREQVCSFFENIYTDYQETGDRTNVQKAQMISFSPEIVVVKKFSEPVSKRYYVVSENNRIVVYYEDKTTVYDKTEISVDDLPKEEKTKLQNGFYVDTAEELFALLESYTS